MQTDFLQIGNGELVARERIPHLSFEDFRGRALDMVGGGGKVVHYFAYPDAGRIKLLAVLRTNRLWVAGCDAPDRLVSMAAQCEPFHLFEREIAEQYGLPPEGHPWLKMVRYHPNLSGRPDVFGNDYSEDIPGRYDYYQVQGDQIHEVAVGPVHAGVIEPGHFRFNCIGERVLHLEIQLGYQHRGQNGAPGKREKPHENGETGSRGNTGGKPDKRFISCNGRVVQKKTAPLLKGTRDPFRTGQHEGRNVEKSNQRAPRDQRHEKTDRHLDERTHQVPHRETPRQAPETNGGNAAGQERLRRTARVTLDTAGSPVFGRTETDNGDPGYG